VILAEPKALIGLAGARVSKQAGVSRIPDDFQTTEFVFNHGLLDRIVHRRDLKNTLTSLVKMLGGKCGG
jgi:acetyl-CoA carboxylase carboxyl transferase subunit beta